MTIHEKGINSGDLMAFRDSNTKLKSMIPGLTSNHKPRDQNHLRGSRYDKEKSEKSLIQGSEPKKSTIISDRSPSPFIRTAETSPQKRNLRYYDGLNASIVSIDEENEDKSYYWSKLQATTPNRNRSKSKENFRSCNFDYSPTPTPKKVYDDVNSVASENKEMDRSPARGTSQSMVKMRNLSRDISSSSGFNSLNVHNPITNPIPFTIQNPYIIKEIQLGNYRSRSTLVTTNT